MRFWTIWSFRKGMYPLKEKLRRTRDWFALAVAERLPVRLQYWTAIHMIGKATMTAPNVPAADVSYVLNHMPKPADVS